MRSAGMVSTGSIAWRIRMVRAGSPLARSSVTKPSRRTSDKATRASPPKPMVNTGSRTLYQPLTRKGGNRSSRTAHKGSTGRCGGISRTSTYIANGRIFAVKQETAIRFSQFFNHFRPDACFLGTRRIEVSFVVMNIRGSPEQAKIPWATQERRECPLCRATERDAVSFTCRRLYCTSY